jgi:hypothetical protein
MTYPAIPIFLPLMATCCSFGCAPIVVQQVISLHPMRSVQIFGEISVSVRWPTRLE